MELRSFAHAKQRIEQHAKDRKGEMPKGASVEKVWLIQSEVVKEDREMQKMEGKQ